MSGFLVVCLIGLGLIALSGTIILLIKLGVIVQKASEPPHIDHGAYSIDQGREVTNDDPPQRREW